MSSLLWCKTAAVLHHTWASDVPSCMYKEMRESCQSQNFSKKNKQTLVVYQCFRQVKKFRAHIVWDLDTNTCTQIPRILRSKILFSVYPSVFKALWYILKKQSSVCVIIFNIPYQEINSNSTQMSICFKTMWDWQMYPLTMGSRVQPISTALFGVLKSMFSMFAFIFSDRYSSFLPHLYFCLVVEFWRKNIDVFDCPSSVL